MTLPCLVSLPHAGTEIPNEVADINLLTPEQIVKDGDVGAAQIYQLRERVEHFVTTDIARAYVDMNRAIDDFRDDGVVKTVTCWQEPIYSKPLASETVQQLLSRYYADYHAALEKAYSDEIVLGVDCHTMAAFGPPIGPDPGRPRPMICLGDANGQTLPSGWMDALSECFSTAFQLPAARNVPFSGGYTTRHHGKSRPWVQVEISRCPSLSWEEKRLRVREALDAFFRHLS
ncbi:MAG: N-formylglutamate deformylase [Pirellulaceae bacterium]|jgi:N-formylglutamate deformylase